MKHEKSCGFILIRDQQALLLKHQNGQHWDFCKGHVEKGESELETALREVKEELGGMVEPIAGFRESIAYSPKKDVHKIVVFFLGRYYGNIDVQAKEISEAIWVDFDQVEETLTFRENKELWTRALEFMHQYQIK